jgi:hypothetical protein
MPQQQYISYRDGLFVEDDRGEHGELVVPAPAPAPPPAPAPTPKEKKSPWWRRLFDAIGNAAGEAADQR